MAKLEQRRYNSVEDMADMPYHVFDNFMNRSMLFA